MDTNLGNVISSNNIFPADSDQLYYFVREGVTDSAWRAEGYCKKIKVVSEMIDGSVQLDGFFKADLGIGDVFWVRSCPEKSLKCIHLINKY